MKMKDAMDIINEKSKGYMVSFEKIERTMLRSDHFPDKHSGEPLIDSERKAWALAHKFASKTYGKCVNIYVVDDNFRPVACYQQHMIINRRTL